MKVSPAEQKLFISIENIFIGDEIWSDVSVVVIVTW